MSLEPVRSLLLDYAGRTITFDEVGAKAKKSLGPALKGRVMTVLEEAAAEIRNEIILSMRNSPATGNLYFRGYRTAKNKKTGKTSQKAIYHRASQALFPPRPDSGDLIRSIIMDARMVEVEVGSIITDPPYPQFLEKGTNKMEPRPWLEPAQLKIYPKMKVNLRRIFNTAAQGLRE